MAPDLLELLLQTDLQSYRSALGNPEDGAAGAQQSSWPEGITNPGPLRDQLGRELVNLLDCRWFGMRVRHDDILTLYAYCLFHQLVARLNHHQIGPAFCAYTPRCANLLMQRLRNDGLLVERTVLRRAPFNDPNYRVRVVYGMGALSYLAQPSKDRTQDRVFPSGMPIPLQPLLRLLEDRLHDETAAATGQNAGLRASLWLAIASVRLILHHQWADALLVQRRLLHPGTGQEMYPQMWKGAQLRLRHPPPSTSPPVDFVAHIKGILLGTSNEAAQKQQRDELFRSVCPPPGTPTLGAIMDLGSGEAKFFDTKPERTQSIPTKPPSGADDGMLGLWETIQGFATQHDLAGQSQLLRTFLKQIGAADNERHIVLTGSWRDRVKLVMAEPNGLDEGRIRILGSREEAENSHVAAWTAVHYSGLLGEVPTSQFFTLVGNLEFGGGSTQGIIGTSYFHNQIGRSYAERWASKNRSLEDFVDDFLSNTVVSPL